MEAATPRRSAATSQLVVLPVPPRRVTRMKTVQCNLAKPDQPLGMYC